MERIREAVELYLEVEDPMIEAKKSLIRIDRHQSLRAPTPLHHPPTPS